MTQARTLSGPSGLALKSANLGTGHGRAEIGIFAGAFDDAAPARVARDVDHRSKCPADAGGASVLAGEVLRGFFDAGIPGGGHGQRDREDGAIPVDDVEGKEDGDVEAGLVDREVLQAVDLLDVDEPEDGADLALDDEVVGLLGGQQGHDDAGGLVHLADFFLDGHLLQQFFGPAVRLGLRHGRRLCGEDCGKGDDEKG